MTVNVPAGAMAHSARINVQTPGIQIKDGAGNSMATTEFKTFTFGVGLTQLTSTWNVTSDGVNFTKQDYTHSLVSVTH